MTTTTHRHQSNFARRYFSAGEAHGEVSAVLAILDARGVEIPEQIRAEIAGCTDLDRLDSWIRQAATADKIQNLDVPISG
ncbi:hypothetical protein GCM10010399_11490 [Dactylosporangium fulvum]|uniref:Transposase n=1 Tax=Dactylosporangium fulvum TaxID=53359 RepID=A0ABY5W5Y4_9ACTN|nr:hypothetical protein [Dactylosporangium fulvum]UWP84434.1 hypothetical protein Dfulv_09420 [Dactylosporangium fulvum]